MEKEPSRTIEELLLEMYDFSNYSEEEKQSFISETTSMITEAALIRSLESAGEQKQKGFDYLMQMNPTDEQVANFIQNNLPDFESYLQEEFELFNTINTLPEEDHQKDTA